MDKKKKEKITKVICSILISIECLSFFILTIMFIRIEEQTIRIVDLESYIASSFGIFVVILFTIHSYKSIIKQSYLYSELEKYLLEEFSSDKPITNDSENLNIKPSKKDILSLMVDNARRIKSYFSISITQEIASYIISIFCAVSGVIIIFYSIFVALNNAEIEVAVISIVSGAITEAVAGMVLLIHNKSAEQLNYYYKALHENEKFLSAINLADKLEKKEKEQMYMEIIKAQIRVNGEKEGGEK